MDLATLQLSPELFKPIIEQHIKNAMMQALGDPTKAVEAIVNKCLSDKVNDRGIKSNSSYDNTHNFMDIVFRNTIQEAAKQVLVEWASENAEIIKAAVIKEISSKKGSQSFAKAVIDGVVASIKSTYQVSVAMKFNSNE